MIDEALFTIANNPDFELNKDVLASYDGVEPNSLSVHATDLILLETKTQEKFILYVETDRLTFANTNWTFSQCIPYKGIASNLISVHWLSKIASKYFDTCILGTDQLKKVLTPKTWKKYGNRCKLKKYFHVDKILSQMTYHISAMQDPKQFRIFNATTLHWIEKDHADPNLLGFITDVLSTCNKLGIFLSQFYITLTEYKDRERLVISSDLLNLDTARYEHCQLINSEPRMTRIDQSALDQELVRQINAGVIKETDRTDCKDSTPIEINEDILNSCTLACDMLCQTIRRNDATFGLNFTDVPYPHLSDQGPFEYGDLDKH